MSDLINQALECHKQGRLKRAAELYQQILTRQPHNADILHLLGLIGLQSGQPAQAAEQIGRAVALQPGVALYHCHLGEAHRALGRPELAAACCRTALRLRPEDADAANNLGLALQALGRNEDALAQFRAAIRLRPDFTLACNNLGNALRESGDIPQAILCFRKALRLDPNLVQAHTNLGQLLLEQHDVAGALLHCSTAVRLRPDLTAAQNNLGNVLREQGRLTEAKACYAEALRLSPTVGLLHNNMAQALQEEGELEQALAWYQQGLNLEPQSPRIHANLASVLAELDREAEAVPHYEEALRLDPSYAEAHNRLGYLRQNQGQPEEAARHYQQALRCKPQMADAHVNLGGLHEELGDFDRAQACWREALRHNPAHAGAVAHLAVLLRGKLPEADLLLLQRLLDGPYLSAARRSALHFGLAQVLDARGAYEQAAEQLRQANRLRLADWQRRGRGYDPAAHTRFVDELLAVFTPAFFEKVRTFGTDSERPIFIFGLPRSGTTLLEQILASHSQVFGAGELRLARASLEALPRLLASRGCQPPEATPLDCVRHLDRATALQAAAEYLGQVEQMNAQACRVTDKMPDNYQYLGLLAVLFPRAQFIHCRRDLRDVAVSCWMTNFREIVWACDPEYIAARFHDYRRLMDHWRTVLPVPVLEVDYEETVADLEGTAQRLVAWCGLEWETRCLAFHKTARPVRTASTTQVRQPIYARSVERWRHYEKDLGDLFARLVPAAESAEGLFKPQDSKTRPAA